LLEDNISDDILDQQFSGLEGFLLLDVGSVFILRLDGAPPLRPGVDMIAELTFGKLVTPISEGTFSVFMMLPFVHQSDAAAFVKQGKADRRPYQPAGTFL